MLYFFPSTFIDIWYNSYMYSKFDRRTRTHSVGIVDAHYGIRLVDHG